MSKMEIKIEGYAVEEKRAKPIGNSCYVNIPKSWEGKLVKVILLEE